MAKTGNISASHDLGAPAGVTLEGTKTLNTQDLADALQRDAQLKKTRKELLRAIFNRAGLERLRAITDADWREAQERDKE